MLKTTTILFLVFLSVLAALHFIALSLYLYWQIWWFDIPMHLLGGVTVVLGLATFVDLRLLPSWLLASRFRTLLITLGIAIAWEVFQYIITEVMKPNYVSDTTGDIAVGLLGAYAGFSLVRALRNNQFS